MKVMLNQRFELAPTLTMDYGHASAIHIIIERQDTRFNLPGVLEIFEL